MRNPALQAAVVLLLGLAAVVILGPVPAVASPAGTATADTTEANASASVTFYRAADVDGEDLQSADDIEREIADGSIENATVMLERETLVVAIDDERLASHHEPANDSDGSDAGTSSTERFFDSLEEESEGGLRLFQTNFTPETLPTERRLGPENTTAYRNASVTYLVVDPAIPAAADGSVSYRDRYGIALGSTHRPYPMDEAVEFYGSKADVLHLSSGDPLPTEELRREVEINVPGDGDDEPEIRLELDGENGTETRTVPVTSVPWSDHHGFSADLDDVEPGSEYELELHYDGDVVDSYAGVVREPWASVEVDEVTETTVDGEPARELTLEVGTSHGGAILVTGPDREQLYYSAGLEPKPDRSTETLRIPGENGRPALPVDEEIHVHLEREHAAVESTYPIGSPAAVVPAAENSDGKADGTNDGTENRSPTEPGAGETAEEPADDVPGFGIVAVAAATATVVLSLVGRRLLE
ncbi:hypothetical protein CHINAEXTREME_08120 [Halobiforma lacisalsi AJ5]|uniref:Uncharacterized protein n=1 Tax=Natronobacterium lacisalsi AJ5 TaxID=358396 RepID=M0LWK5_NATLA|nr:hypothetical protein [Halobiforma lacisalsi]APW97744.1 hypothetical protein CHINAEXTREME_08120 [Halobiforma lacisalsi AJ5]EMA37513.1 hypothetical protein C445_01461 [Halobiforma lacisalsi AJ5]